jgi:hypothetical protein
MLNPDILGGLKSAITRGYSLEEAMLSFLNAGYKREEIEEAAQSFQTQAAQASASIEWSPQPIWASKQNLQTKQIKPVLISTPKQMPAAPPKQVVTKGVAAYTNHNVSRIRTITIILVILLLVLLGILGLMYLFKNQIIDFFNNLF